MNPFAQATSSKDYKRLVQLVRKSAVICLVDYRPSESVDGEDSARDVARATVQSKDGKDVFSISARGNSYVTAFSEDEFSLGCANNNIAFFDPSKKVQDEESD